VVRATTNDSWRQRKTKLLHPCFLGDALWA